MLATLTCRNYYRTPQQSAVALDGYELSVMQRPNRTRVAFLVAPLASVIVFMGAATVVLLNHASDPGTVWQSLPGGSFMTAFFGLPIAYAVEFIVGVPAFRALEARGGVRSVHVILIATLLGAMIMPLIWVEMWGHGIDWYALVLGVAMGAGSGVLFSAIAFPRSATRPAI